jgi:hypothetical protein
MVVLDEHLSVIRNAAERLSDDQRRICGRDWLARELARWQGDIARRFPALVENLAALPLPTDPSWLGRTQNLLEEVRQASHKRLFGGAGHSPGWNDGSLVEYAIEGLWLIARGLEVWERHGDSLPRIAEQLCLLREDEGEEEQEQEQQIRDITRRILNE